MPAFSIPGLSGTVGNRFPGVNSGNSDVMNRLASLMGGLSPALETATANTANNLAGNLSPSLTRTANALYGANSGLGPGSEFLRNRGFDLYRKASTGLQQQGMQDIMGLLSGISGAYNPLYSTNVNAQVQREGIGQRASEASAQDWVNRGQLAVELLKARNQGGWAGGAAGAPMTTPDWARNYLF